MPTPEEEATRNQLAKERVPRSRRTIPGSSSAGTRVTVLYYLCRNGRHLEHPHLMELHLASPHLYLGDVLRRLDKLRGKGMAAMYSWSCKRRYKTGFVWHDVSDDDLLFPVPTQGQSQNQGSGEYVLKGSLLLHHSPLPEATPAAPPLPDHHHHQQNACATIDPTKVQCIKITSPREESPACSQGSQEGAGCWTSNSSSSSPTPPIAEEAEAPPPPPQQQQQQQPLPGLPSSPSSTSSITEDGNGDEEPVRSSCSTSPDKPRARGLAGSALSSSGGTSSPCPAGHNLAPYNQEGNSSVAGQDTATQTNGNLVGKELHHKTTGISNMTATPTDANKDLQRRGQAGSCFSGTGGRSGTLESLIRAEAVDRRSSASSTTHDRRILEQDECPLLDDKEALQSLKPANLLMRLVACGSNMSVGHHPACGLMRTAHRPRYLTTRHVHVELPPTSPVLAPLGTLIMRHPQTDATRAFSEPGDSCSHCRCKGEESAKGMHSSSCNEPGVSNKYAPHTIKMTPCEQPEIGTLDVSGEQECSCGPSLKTLKRSTSKRMSDLSSGKIHSPRAVSFHDEKEKAVKIEERLASGARVIIQCAPMLKDNYISAKAM
ncbi:hypothetical protein ACP4OV_031705 [Aristida adscensionis]